jgi:hypothetical protein
MFNKFQPFYTEAIRKSVIAFGSLFNQIYFNRKDDTGTVVETSRVPLIYGPKEKFIQKLKAENSFTDTAHVRMSLPRMAFEITGFLYDSERKLNRLNQKYGYLNGSIGSYIEVPYSINFGLYLFTRNLDDNLQIIEQILPYFAPEFTVTLNMNELNKKVDVPIVLNSMNVIEDYEGDFETRRSVNTVFDFTMKTYVYGPIKNDIYLINDFELNLFEGATMGNDTKVYSGGWTGNIATLSGITAYENP